MSTIEVSYKDFAPIVQAISATLPKSRRSVQYVDPTTLTASNGTLSVVFSNRDMVISYDMPYTGDMDGDSATIVISERDMKSICTIVGNRVAKKRLADTIVLDWDMNSRFDQEGNYAVTDEDALTVSYDGKSFTSFYDRNKEPVVTPSTVLPRSSLAYRFPASEFVDVYASVSKAASSDSSFAQINAVTLQSREGKLAMQATDRFRIHDRVFTHASVVRSDEGKDVRIPLVAAKFLSKLGPFLTGAVSVHTSDNGVSIACDRVRMKVHSNQILPRLFKANGSIVPTECTMSAVLDTRELKQAALECKRAKTGYNSMSISLRHDGKVELVSSGVSISLNGTVTGVDEADPYLSLNVNPVYFYDAVCHVDSEDTITTFVTFKDLHRPIVVVPGDHSGSYDIPDIVGAVDRRGVVMPCRG